MSPVRAGRTAAVDEIEASRVASSTRSGRADRSAPQMGPWSCETPVIPTAYPNVKVHSCSNALFGVPGTCPSPAHRANNTSGGAPSAKSNQKSAIVVSFGNRDGTCSLGPSPTAGNAPRLLSRQGTIPYLYCAVLAAAGEPSAVRAEGHAPDRADVFLESEEFLAGLRLPYLHGLVTAGAGDPLAVRTEFTTPSVPPATTLRCSAVWRGRRRSRVCPGTRKPNARAGPSSRHPI